MPTPVVMPQLGESVVEGKIVRWLKREGEQVQRFEPLLEVETDKVTTEVTAPDEGTLLRIYFPEGITLKAGTLIAMLGKPGEPVPERPYRIGHGGEIEPLEEIPAVPAPAPAPAPPSPPSAPEPTPAARREGGPRISPVVAKIAAEYGIDLSRVPGTGEGGRVTKKDLMAYIERMRLQPVGAPAVQEAELPPWEQPGTGELFRPTEEVLQAAPAPAAPPAPTPTPPPPLPAAPALEMPFEVIPLTSMRRAIAEHMVRSKHTSPHVTTVFEVDMSRVMAHYEVHRAAFEREGARLTLTPYFIMAAIAALKAYPIVNSTWTDEGIRVYKVYHIGLAVSLGDEGLVVPVLRNADAYSLIGLARAVQDLVERARQRRLKPEEIQGGTFTITNHGISGSLFATPIIHQPQCAIMGVGRVHKRPVVLETPQGDVLAIRPMVYLTLTFDHRIIDGAQADAFMSKVKATLENWA
ncbi:dihydrolipoamide acetyltransferase family protein [Thermoflexus sp.]|uniref:dihydrolipoamide acetyltransferase family protein n=1 Tax=Thermoflexus sp. TaxID=1969742 RepID=UPI002ADE2AE4|nr:dihydrolipoamide acetyltransferase family protein [Thermoflexus sp.]